MLKALIVDDEAKARDILLFHLENSVPQISRIETAGSAPEALEKLVRMAGQAGASDIHLQMRGKAAEVSFRLDGVLAPVATVDDPLAEHVFGRIKFLARL